MHLNDVVQVDGCVLLGGDSNLLLFTFISFWLVVAAYLIKLLVQLIALKLSSSMREIVVHCASEMQELRLEHFYLVK